MGAIGIWRVETGGGPRLATGPVEEGPRQLLAGDLRLADALSTRGTGLDVLLTQPAREAVPADSRILPPVDRQPVWAAGVTYERSRDGRLEESGGADIYARVYDADRPELFFKALPDDVRGTGAPIAVRADSAWNVPEPELGLVVDARGDIAGYVLGDDVSSRDIEAENPLYLPQAKVYDGSCALGPCVVPASQAPALDTVEIGLTIDRSGGGYYADRASLSRMKRTPEELVDWLLRAITFPHGVILLTGTGIVPDVAFSLSTGDTVTITAPGLGTLVNRVELSRLRAPAGRTP